MVYELDKEPKLEITKVISYGMIYLGYLLFLVALHISSITIQNIKAKDVMVTTFSIFLMIYVGMLIFGLVGIVAQFLKWLVWQIQTPQWKKDKVRGLK